MHNSMTLYQYPSKECCEEAYLEDASGCLVGGQFNGRPVGWTEAVSGVTCKSSTPNQYAADCSSVPGGYDELGPATCRESDVLPKSTSPSNLEDMWGSVRAIVAME